MPESLSRLIELIYQGITETQPWLAFAEGLRQRLAARNVAVTLHHATGQGNDTYVMASIPGDPINWEEVESIYRARFMANDPFSPARMKPGQLLLLHKDEENTEYQTFFSRLGLGPSLRICCAEPGGVRCWIDIVHDCESPDETFSPDDLALINALIPHLSMALGLYARLQRQEAEKVIYEGMVEHFGLGCILLNEVGEIIHINTSADHLLKCWPGITLRRGRLVLAERTAQRALDAAITTIIATHEWENRDGELVRLDPGDGRLLALLIHPAPLQPYYRGDQAPCVIIYLADLASRMEALNPDKNQALERLGQIFELTRQEANLALLLAYGHTIAEASREMGIAEIAARNYSKKIYAKMGIASQTDLVRRVLRSLSFLG